MYLPFLRSLFLQAGSGCCLVLFHFNLRDFPHHFVQSRSSRLAGLGLSGNILISSSHLKDAFLPDNRFWVERCCGVFFVCFCFVGFFLASLCPPKLLMRNPICWWPYCRFLVCYEFHFSCFFRPSVFVFGFWQFD